MDANENQDTHHSSDSDQGLQTARRAARSALEECLLCTRLSDGATSPPTDVEEWLNAQAQSLLRWAQQTGRFLSAPEFGHLIGGFKKIHSGLEHEVFFRKKAGRVFKITKPPHFGHTWDLQDYLQNLLWSNELFEDDVELEGVICVDDGVSIVTSQAYIHGRAPTVEEVATWFKKLGAVSVGTYRWRLPNSIVISDAHTGNLILMADGTMVPIDVHVELSQPLPALESGVTIRLIHQREK